MADTNFSLIDLNALSKPACKLIEAVQSAVGIIYEPTHIRRKAKAEVDAAIIKLEGEAEMQEVALRAAERIKTREMRRQQNIESVVGGAIVHLPEAVSEKQVEEDWIIQFFEHCQDVSNGEMQSLWSRLLAGEVAQPGSYSLRTLHVVKTMQKADADLFTRFCSYVWADEAPDEMIAHIYTEQTRKYIKDKRLRRIELVGLDAVGLIGLREDDIAAVSQDSPLNLYYFGKRYTFAPLKPKEKPEMSVYVLTDVGRQLAPICGAQADEKYLALLIQSLKNEGISVTPS